jgi:site-specific DNA-methyltransferase (adenine-specific)
VTYEGEVVLDSFAGSGVVGEASLNKKRNCILIEILKENIIKINNRLTSKIYFEMVWNEYCSKKGRKKWNI